MTWDVSYALSYVARDSGHAGCGGISVRRPDRGFMRVISAACRLRLEHSLCQHMVIHVVDTRPHVAVGGLA